MLYINPQEMRLFIDKTKVRLFMSKTVAKCYEGGGFHRPLDENQLSMWELLSKRLSDGGDDDGKEEAGRGRKRIEGYALRRPERRWTVPVSASHGEVWQAFCI